MAVHSETLDRLVNANSQTMRAALEGVADEINTRLATQGQTFSRDVAAAISGIEATLAARGGDLAQAVSGQIDGLRKLLDGQGAEFVANLGVRGAEISDSIAGIGTRAEKSFEQRVTALVALLTRRGDDLLAAVSESPTPVTSAK